MRLLDADGRSLAGDPVTETLHFLRSGKIVAIKGLGGNARLVITGDEILDSGVQVIAPDGVTIGMPPARTVPVRFCWPSAIPPPNRFPSRPARARAQ